METILYLTQEQVDKIMNTLAIESDNDAIVETFIAKFEDGYEIRFELHEGYLEVFLYDSDGKLIAESNWYSTETFKANGMEYTFTLGEDGDEDQVEYIACLYTRTGGDLLENLDAVRRIP